MTYKTETNRPIYGLSHSNAPRIVGNPNVIHDPRYQAQRARALMKGGNQSTRQNLPSTDQSVESIVQQAIATTHSSVTRINGGYGCEVTVSNQLGIHARPAALLVKIAARYDCVVEVDYDGRTVSGKSMMGWMTLQANQGKKLKLYAHGQGAEQCLKELEALVLSKFGEN